MTAHLPRGSRRLLLDHVYSTLNHRANVGQDPVSFLYGFDDPLDREIVALIASGLAYGRVVQIARSVASVLAYLRHPGQVVRFGDLEALAGALAGFRHRFTTGHEVVFLLLGMRRVVRRFGSLRECMLAGMDAGDATTLRGLHLLVAALNPEGRRNSLLSAPSRGSACKRHHLLLRWMVRRDDVDPGGWEDIGASRLVVPLDTHMFRVARRLGFTTRAQADCASAVEITEAFRSLCPDDPVRYDFSLTRLAMAGPAAEDALVSRWHDAGPGAGPSSRED